MALDRPENAVHGMCGFAQLNVTQYPDPDGRDTTPPANTWQVSNGSTETLSSATARGVIWGVWAFPSSGLNVVTLRNHAGTSVLCAAVSDNVIFGRQVFPQGLPFREGFRVVTTGLSNYLILYEIEGD